VIVRAEAEGQLEKIAKGAPVEVVQAEFEGGMEIARRALTHFAHDSEKAQEAMLRVREGFYAGGVPS
jgi:hypothetical protein